MMALSNCSSISIKSSRAISPYLTVKAYCLSIVQLSQIACNSFIFLISGNFGWTALGAWKQILQASNPLSFLVILQTNISLPDDSCDWTELLNRDNPWSQRRFLLSWCLGRVSQICYDVMNTNRHKNKQRINTHHDVRKSKRCKHIENALLFLNNKFSFSKSRTVHVRGAGKSI